MHWCCTDESTENGPCAKLTSAQSALAVKADNQTWTFSPLPLLERFTYYLTFCFEDKLSQLVGHISFFIMLSLCECEDLCLFSLAVDVLNPIFFFPLLSQRGKCLLCVCCVVMTCG